MFRKSTGVKVTFLLIAIAFIAINRSSAQSNIQVKTTKNRTSVVVTNFPKNVTVLIVDENHNLLSVASTDEKGTAVVNFDKRIRNAVIARTIHGDYEVSSRTEKFANKESQMASNRFKRTIKA